MCWSFVKLYLMLWKSGLHSIRHLPKTIFDILVPAAFFLLMTFSRKEYQDRGEPLNITSSSAFDDNFFTPPNGQQLLPVVAYSPNNSIFAEFLESTNRISATSLTFVGVGSAQDLNVLLKQNRTIIAGIQFNHPSNVTDLPQNFNFSLRFPAMMRFYNMPWPTGILYKEQAFYRFPRDKLDADFYKKEGFTALQFRIMNRLVITNYSNRTTYHPFDAKQFPHFPKNLNFDKFQFLFPPLILICFHYTYCNTICNIVVERKKQTNEMMKLMGISNWIFWLSLYLQKMLSLIVSVTIIVYLMKSRLGYSEAVFENSDFLLVWLFILDYCMCFTSLGFLLSVFFTDIKTAISISTLIWFLSFWPFIITHVNYTTLPDYVKMALCIFPNTAMGYGTQVIFQLELMLNDGLDRSTLWNSQYDILSVGMIMCVMMGTAIVCLVILFYIIPVFPGTYGVAQPFFYLFKKDYWNRQRNYKHEPSNKKGPDTTTQQAAENDVDNSNFEDQPDNRTPGVRIFNLTKAYVKGKEVVRNLSLNIYKNEITVLCGANGAGTTTLMLILTGMIKATTGTVLIDGYEIGKQTNMARRSMSLCPQQNILLDDLTAGEHILFYSLIKGSSIKAAKAAVKKYSKLLEFDNELGVIATNLSNGTQRKLSIALALCGQSKFVFLDQPTNGLDPAVRRSFWNVLSSERRERHILMTTHSSDEVDVLADRVAFMIDGELKCCGSSIFMRKRFGIYRLLCVKQDDCKSIETKTLLGKYFPGITVETETSSQLSYLLSYDKVHKFGRIFEKLETFYVSQLKLKSFSVSIVTGQFMFREFIKDLDSDESSAESLQIEDDSDIRCLRGIVLIPFQFAAMLMKRFLCGIRDWRSFIVYNVILFILLTPIKYDFNSSPDVLRSDPPPLEMSLDSYENSHCFFEKNRRNVTITPFLFNITRGYYDQFSARPNPLIILKTNNLLSLAKKWGVQKYRYNLLIGGSMKGKRHFWINTFSALHTLPIGLKYIMASRMYPEVNVTIINEPVGGDTTAYRAAAEYTNMEVFGIGFPIFIAILMSIWSSAHIVFYIKEKKCRAKIKQYVNGANHFIFWITSIVWDLAISVVPILVIVLWLHISERAYWSEIDTLYIVAFIIFTFNLAMLSIICLLSLMFSNPATGVNTLCAVNTFTCMALFVNNYGVEFISDPTVKQIMSVIPTCALIECLSTLEIIGVKCQKECDDCDKEKRENLCKNNPECCPTFSFLWNDEAMKRELLFMAYTSLAAFLILLVVEHELFQQLMSYAWNFMLRPMTTVKKVQYDSEDDSDSEGSMDELIGNDMIGDGQQMSLDESKSEEVETKVVMRKVSKYYGRRLAVDRMSLSIQLGECVGLIGTNEMGKTTIFKLLTGEHRICYGKASIVGHNLKWNTRGTCDFVGYCPQTDGLWDDLTVRQTLKFFCMLRGSRFVHASDMAVILNLSQYFGHKVCQLSGGNKQILSIVIALIGRPSVVFIDEATTCVDANNKRNFGMILEKFRNTGTSILLASDCMEEYKSLCTRFIIADGTDSSLLHFEPRLIEILIESNMAEYDMNNREVIDFMKNTFKKAEIRSRSMNFLAYNMPFSQNVLSKLFIAFEKRKRLLYIENYFICVK